MKTAIKMILPALLLASYLALATSESQANLGRRCPPPPPQTVVLAVCHPCTGCKFEIPVCIPACCQGVPTVCFKNTLIGSGKTVFEWSCGHRVVVRYTNCGGYHVLER